MKLLFNNDNLYVIINYLFVIETILLHLFALKALIIVPQISFLNDNKI